jgi:hypothetical protein
LIGVVDGWGLVAFVLVSFLFGDLSVFVTDFVASDSSASCDLKSKDFIVPSRQSTTALIFADDLGVGLDAGRLANTVFVGVALIAATIDLTFDGVSAFGVG